MTPDKKPSQQVADQIPQPVEPCARLARIEALGFVYGALQRIPLGNVVMLRETPDLPDSVAIAPWYWRLGDCRALAEALRIVKELREEGLAEAQHEEP